MKLVIQFGVFFLSFSVFLVGCSGFTKLGTPARLVDTQQLSKEELIDAERSILQTSGVVNYHQEDTILHSEALEAIAIMIGIALFVYIGTRI